MYQAFAVFNCWQTRASGGPQSDENGHDHEVRGRQLRVDDWNARRCHHCFQVSLHTSWLCSTIYCRGSRGPLPIPHTTSFSMHVKAGSQIHKPCRQDAQVATFCPRTDSYEAIPVSLVVVPENLYTLHCYSGNNWVAVYTSTLQVSHPPWLTQ